MLIGGFEPVVFPPRAVSAQEPAASAEFSYLLDVSAIETGNTTRIPLVEQLPDVVASDVIDREFSQLPDMPLIGDPSDDLAVGESACDLDEDELVLDEYWYRGAGHRGLNGWLIGKGDSMGIFTLGSNSTYDFTKQSHDVAVDFAIHWIMGPRQTDMPARMYDFLVRWGHRQNLTDRFGYDLSFSLGFYSDFEGSARKGLRWPSTAVTYYRSSEQWQWLLGVDILDRDDYFCLPIAGAVWTPRADLRFDLVFPRPRVAFHLPRCGWLYLGGEMGGGMWAVERATGLDDVVTYRDFRAVLGITNQTKQGFSWFSQVGVAFDRQLEFRSGQGDFSPRSVVMLDLSVMY